MKKCLLILTTVLCFNSLYSQVLYNETFSSYTLGNLGTDPSGTTPGQNGWLTQCSSNSTISNNYFNITSEANKGNVLTLGDGAVLKNDGVIAKKVNIDALINQRTTGNNVIKLEIDYYTGAQFQFSNNSHKIILGYDTSHNTYSPSRLLLMYQFRPMSGQFYVSGAPLGGNVKLDKNALTHLAVLPFNTWVTLIVYLDYNNKKVYFETPYFNTIAATDFYKNSTSTNLIEDFKPTVLAFSFSSPNENPSPSIVSKYDNIKITALNAVPPNIITLSTNEQLSQKFNLYPNPATNLVNITNSENMLVNQVTVYNIAGKQLSTQSFNHETQIKLNVENLASGTYMLHLKTNKGTAVKKLVKK